MDENKWVEQLKNRADETVFRDVLFTRAMEEKVRRTISRRSRFLTSWQRLAIPVATLLVLVFIWQTWPLQSPSGQQHAAIPTKPAPDLLPGGALEVPVLWKPSPRTETVYDSQPFSYIGEKPVRIVTDEAGFYEGQQQRVFWLLDASQSTKVELVAYSSEGERLSLGTYQVSGPLFDAQGHFPSGITLPEPGIWKLQVLADGKHLGQVFVEVKAGISPTNREMVEPIIRTYLETEGAKLGGLGEDREVTIELLGVEAPNAARRNVYAWVKILSKDPRLSSGVSAPMAFEITYNGKEYKVTKFQMPEDGNRYQSSLQKMFPPKVLERLHSR
ncbi:hypothetical protein [Brevibacillus choshinensis]|uniref:hypothetical protein n=1 Tax=Brevibacillus choshinensis TaxID=54911 RepID=UPI002E1CAFAD|nr:hypothetical protein [Brevibacillus choshinensis]MED4754166.1 hypothetical protein [Brevibacillus choshinensis]MED4779297.1 hypothetical protein [Brevibacillus choshinensis]